MSRKGLTLVELMISMAIFGLILSILVYIVIKLNQENIKNKHLVENLMIASIIGNKIKAASITRDISISYDDINKKYILKAISFDNNKNVEFHLYKTNNTDTFYYVKYNNQRTVKYKIPKYIQFQIKSTTNFYEIIYYVYQKNFENNNHNNRKIAYLILLPKK